MEDSKPTLIGENTKFTFPIIVAVVGLAAWLTKNNFQNEANAQAIQEIKTSQYIKNEKFEQMITDLAVIKDEVHEIKKQMDGR